LELKSTAIRRKISASIVTRLNSQLDTSGGSFSLAVLCYATAVADLNGSRERSRVPGLRPCL